jgi:hypothetical protein
MTDKEKRLALEELDCVGKEVSCTQKGDWSVRRTRQLFGTVEGEVKLIVDDVRHVIQRIVKPDGDVFYRTCYHTWESRVRKNRAKLQIGYGQFPSLLASKHQAKLFEMARLKGWEAFQRTDS